MQQVETNQDKKAPKKPRAPKEDASQGEPSEVRRSNRERAKVSYKEEDYFGDLPRLVGPRAPRPPREVNEDEVEELRRKHGIAAAEEVELLGSQQQKMRAPVDSGKGVRIQVGQT